MRCAACDAECPRDATHCPSCGRPPARRRGRRGPAEEDEPPPWARAAGANRTALRAYRFTLLGLVPGFGLLFGPLGATLGGFARARGKDDAAFTAPGPAAAAVFLGTLITLASWAGAALMALGLHPSPTP